jgi:hypothetical protein
MGVFTLTIKTDNEAFEWPNCQKEIARILRDTATEIESHRKDFKATQSLRDTNGNTVGSAVLMGHNE